MIFSDECSISPPLFMCGRTSRQGATKICIFDGIMGADLFCKVPETTLIPFIIIIIKVTSTSSYRIMTWSTRVGERKLSSTRKKSTGGVLPLMSPDLKPKETLWRELVNGARKLYKEVLGEEGHAREACKINRTYFAKGFFSCVGGSRLEVLKQNITSGSFGSHRALLHLILYWNCTVGS